MYLLLILFSGIIFAQEVLETINVEEKASRSSSDFWEENTGTQIFSGKKNTITSLKEIPDIQTNNYRQAISQTPGLLVSEIPNESMASLSYRGLGDPHESYNLLLLQDGFPVSADMYGYPAHYFSPAIPMMNEVHFLRGGASLHYGPQPGGSLNYISRSLQKNQPFSGKVGMTGGSYNLLTSNNSLYGSGSSSSYGIEYYRRQGEGLQRNNADFHADYLQIRNHWYLSNNKTYKIGLNGYNSDHGNPGGFTKSTGVNDNTYLKDSKKATRLYDRLKVSRLHLTQTLETRHSDQTTSEIDLWGGVYRRYSTQQKGGGFGSFPTLDSTNVVTQEYYNIASRLRLIHHYGDHSLSLGYQFYHVTSPYLNEAGTSKKSHGGEVRKRVDRQTQTHSLFLENRFVFNNLFITPGMRIESISQNLDERKNLDTTNPNLRKDNRTANVPLFGLGVSYHVTELSQLYLNISEAYKPITYQDALPLNTGDVISEDIDPSKILNTEFGYRGKNKGFIYDTSIFHIRYENKFGRVGNQIQNTSGATHQGFELSTEYNLFESFEELKKQGDLNLYFNTTFLDAKFTRGTLEDKKPMYAPKNITRWGLIYKNPNQFKLALMNIMMNKHYADDGNTSNFEIPYYSVWDFTMDYTFKKNWVTHLGVNNLLDRDYTSRVRSDGIYQALGRNYYAGLSYQF